jgi:hypothetical protein
MENAGDITINPAHDILIEKIILAALYHKNSHFFFKHLFSGNSYAISKCIRKCAIHDSLERPPYK